VTDQGPHHAAPPRPTAGAPVVPLSRQLVGRVVARSWWIVAATVVLGAVVGVAGVKAAAPVYQAEAVVVASSTTISPDNFGALAAATFETDTVISPVIRRLRLNTTTQRLLHRQDLAVETVPGAAAVRVVGRAGDSNLAAELANDAAQSFVAAATANGLGRFSVFGSAPRGTLVPVSTSSGLFRGIAAGLLLGLLLIVVRFLWRKPVFGEEDLAAELGVDAEFTARARPSSPRWIPFRRRRYEVYPRGTALAVWRMVDALPSSRAPAQCCVVLVERRAGKDPAVRAVMEDVVTSYWASANGGQARAPLTWKRPEDKELPAALADAAVVVTLVAEGASRRTLRRLEQEMRLFAGEQTRVAVLVR
jgi:capsular polysaccharide biosynthesis protein